METLIVLGIIALVLYWAFRSGKQVGSHKGYHAGRRSRRRRRS